MDIMYRGSFISRKWSESILRKSFSILGNSDRKRVLLVAIMQIFMGGLDLLGVAAIGVLGSLTINGVQSKDPGNRVEWFL